jgi:hypothetical protein
MQATMDNVIIERRSEVRRSRRYDDCFPDGGACVIAYGIVSALAFAFGFVVALVFF